MHLLRQQRKVRNDECTFFGLALRRKNKRKELRRDGAVGKGSLPAVEKKLGRNNVIKVADVAFRSLHVGLKLLKALRGGR